jgi:hypothetical protein
MVSNGRQPAIDSSCAGQLEDCSPGLPRCIRESPISQEGSPEECCRSVRRIRRLRGGHRAGSRPRSLTNPGAGTPPETVGGDPHIAPE